VTKVPKSIAFRPRGPIKLLDTVPLNILEPNVPGAILLEENALRNIEELIPLVGRLHYCYLFSRNFILRLV